MKTKLLLVLMLMASFLHATKTAVTTSTLAGSWTAAANGDTLLLAAGTYTNALALQNGKIITLKGTGKVTFTGTVASGSLTDSGTGIIFDGLTINRGNSYVLDGTTYGNINIVAFRNDTIMNVQRCLVRGSNSTITNLSAIEITNCIIRNCGTGGYAFLNPKFTVQNVTVKNNSLIRYYGENFYLPNTTLSTNILNFDFENNTIFKWSKAASYAICNSAATSSTSSTFTLKNNIIAESCPATPGLKPLLLKTTGGNIIAQKNLIINYGRFSLTTPTTIDTTSNNLTYSNADLYNPAIGFQDTTTTVTATSALNLGILASSSLATASTTGGVIGDPRWLKALTNPTTITTSSSPAIGGTTSPTNNTVSLGDQVTVTATKAFGYTFKEWRDATTNALVSSDNPYKFSLTTNTSLVAIFDAVATYNFSVDKAGTGANWGNVILSPTPNNGKYETGTVVTVTVVPNAVSTFTKWDDNTTDLSKNVTVNSDQTLTAAFDVVPFIVGWDFKTQSPTSKRIGDFYFLAGEKGFFSLYNADGSDASWLASTAVYTPSYPAARMWTPVASFATPRYFHASFSTVGYRDIQIKSKVGASYHAYPVMTLQYSTDSITFTKVNQVDITSVYNTGWADLNYTLPADANNKSRIYVRWVEDATSTPVLGTATDVDGSGISNVYVYASAYTTKNSGTRSIDIVGFKSGNQITLKNVPENSNISVYDFTGKLLKTEVNKSNVYSTAVNTPCIVKVISSNSVQLIKLL